MNWRTISLAAMVGAWVWLWSWSPLAFQDRFRHGLHEGMTLGEAEAVLGKGEFRTRGRTEFRGNPEGDWGVMVVKEDTEFYLWRRDGMEIWLGFLDGRLVHKFFYANPQLSPRSAMSITNSDTVYRRPDGASLASASAARRSPG